MIRAEARTLYFQGDRFHSDDEARALAATAAFNLACRAQATGIRSEDVARQADISHGRALSALADLMLFGAVTHTWGAFRLNPRVP